MRVCGLWLVAVALLAATAVQAAPVPAPPPIEDYGKLPAMDMVRLAPSGQRYAAVVEIDGQRSVLVATTDSVLIQSIPIGDTKIRDLAWAGEDHLLVTTSAAVELGLQFSGDKAELTAVAVINLATGKSFSIFGRPFNGPIAHLVFGKYGVWRQDGHWYGYFGGFTYDATGTISGTFGGGRLRSFPDLYRVDLDTGETTLASPGQTTINSWLVRGDGISLARSLYDQRTSEWRIIGSQGSYVTLQSGQFAYGGADILGFGKTANSMLISVPKDGGYVSEEIPLSGGAPTAIVDEESDAVPVFDSDSHLWIGQVSQTDDADQTLFDPVRNARLQAVKKAFPGRTTFLISYSDDFNHLVVRSIGPTDSGTYWILDFNNGKGNARPLGAAYPDITPDVIGSSKTISYVASDGLTIHAVLTLPPGREAKALPVVVLPHGGPVLRSRPLFDPWVQAFAARGYAVLQPNFRGSGGYGAAFRQAGFGQWGRKMQTDISDGLAELAREGVVDPKRACIAGGDFGGYAALAGVTLQQGLYRCAVSVGGVSDLPRILINLRQLGGDQSASMRFWDKFMGVTSNLTDMQVDGLSPARLASRADAPILLIHGTDDTEVPLEQSKVMAAALTSARKPVETLTLPGADHWFLKEKDRVAMVKASVGFVLKNNPPDAAPVAVAAQ